MALPRRQPVAPGPNPVRFRPAFALALLTVAATARADSRVGVCDLRGALMRTEEGLKAAATLQNYTKKRQGEVDSLQDELKREQEDIKQQTVLLSRRAYQRRLEHWQRRMLAVQDRFIQFNKELATKQQELIGPLEQKLMGAVRRAASRKGFELVVDKAAVGWNDPSLDITDLVVQLYNGGGGGGEDEGEKKKEGAAP